MDTKDAHINGIHGKRKLGRLASAAVLALVLFSCLVLLLSCAPKRPVAKAPEQLEPGADVFADAQQKLAAGRRQEALARFGEYLARFPEGPKADAALLASGKIRKRLGRIDGARDDFLLLVRRFPESRLAADALLDLMEIFYQQRQYGKVLQYASEAMKRPMSSEQMVYVYRLLGDTHLEMGAGKDAVLFYAMAGQQAGPGEKEPIRDRMKKAVRRLKTADIQTLLGRIEDPLARGYLLYQLGLNETEQDNFEAATDALTRFAEQYPDHEYAADARALVEEINNSYTYRPNAIGVLLPLSGPYELYGNRALKGIQLALHRAGGSPSSPPWRLIVRDTGSDPDRAVSAVQEFFTEKVAAIIGPIITAKRAAVEAQALGIPIIVLSQKEGLPGIGSFVFRNFMTPRMQVQTLLSYMVRQRHMRRFGILFPEETYGRTFMKDFWGQAVELGAEVVAAQPYNGDKTDFAGPIRDFAGFALSEEDRPLRDDPADPGPWGTEGRFLEEVLLGVGEKPEPESSDTEPPAYEDLTEPAPIVDFDAVFIPDSAPKIAMVVPQLAYYDITDVVLLGTNLWHSQRLLEEAGQYVQGALVADGYFSESSSPPVKAFAAAYRKAYDEEPGFIEAVAHDTATILFDIVGRSTSKFRSGIRDELLSVQNYPAVTGPTSFDADGEARKRLYLIRVKGGRFIEVGPTDDLSR